jgi:hypothetical protein
VTLLALLFFTGLAIDSGSLYVTYSQLRRSIDAAAVAAANDYKAEYGAFLDTTRMKKAAIEVMKMHDIDATNMDLKMYLCSDTTTAPAEFLSQCPGPGEPGRKLIWIDATLKAPLYFLSLLGFHDVPLRAHAISEAAPIDLVIVIDSSESMADQTPGYTTPYDPTACNLANNCDPFFRAKDAANSLIDTMFEGYDQVAIVNYDVSVNDITTDPNMGLKTLADAKTLVDALEVHNDPPYNQLVSKWFSVHKAGEELLGFNPVFPEDRDGDGADDDEPDMVKAGVPCTVENPIMSSERWDPTINTFGLDEGGTPCDNGNYLDSYHWFDDPNGDGIYSIDEDNQLTKERLFAGCDISTDPPTCPKPTWMYMTPNSTCTGCGIRAAAQILKRDGRSNSVWVMVVLSDGLVNLSDTPLSNPAIPSAFPLGYCTGGIGSFAWGNDCLDLRKDATLSPRYCLDDPATTCPPGSISALSDTSLYSVYDYALDMIDYAALQKSENASEITGGGSDIAIYSIGLGGAGATPSGASGPIGEYLLRYAASVGDDGERKNDPCAGVPSQTNCGQYYYTATGAGLSEIFNDISTRIYSRLTQ